MISKLSGVDMAQVLKKTVAQFGRTVASLDPDPKGWSLDTEIKASSPEPQVRKPGTTTTVSHHDYAVLRPGGTPQMTSLGPSAQSQEPYNLDVNLPQIQRHVVEHS